MKGYQKHYYTLSNLHQNKVNFVLSPWTMKFLLLAHTLSKVQQTSRLISVLNGTDLHATIQYSFIVIAPPTGKRNDMFYTFMYYCYWVALIHLKCGQKWTKDLDDALL